MRIGTGAKTTSQIRRRRRGGAPPDHQSVEDWGRGENLGRTASYAAVRRGEVPVVVIGGRMWVPSDWRDQVRTLAAAEMRQRRQRHIELLRQRGEARAQAEAGADGPDGVTTR